VEHGTAMVRSNAPITHGLQGNEREGRAALSTMTWPNGRQKEAPGAYDTKGLVTHVPLNPLE